MANEKGPKLARPSGGYEGVSPRAEEEILSFWRRNKIFEKSVALRQAQGKKHFVFFEGPPYPESKTPIINKSSANFH